MNKKLNEALECVTGEVLSQLAFMFALSPEDSGEATFGAELSLGASVDFDGELTGSLAVLVDVGLASALASNMLGLEEGQQPTPEQKDDALKELANILCGNLLPTISSDEVEYAVRPPRLVDTTEHAPPSVAQVDLALSEGRVRTILSFGEEGANLGEHTEASRGTIAP